MWLRFTGINEANNRILTSTKLLEMQCGMMQQRLEYNRKRNIRQVPKPGPPNGTNLGDSRIEDRAGTLQLVLTHHQDILTHLFSLGLEMTNGTALVTNKNSA
ncbi:MAG: hypothetical protein IPI78_18835 [Chitinophagaceae bacterium]|nr:hypothetical protein [Chitinophagaceae bacterium]